MLLVSSNDAAHAIAGFVGADGLPKEDTAGARVKFVSMMNEKAKTLDFSTMEFFNESGLDIDKAKNGGYGSAHDVAALMAILWQTYPTTLEITARKDARITSQDNIVHILPNTNEAAGRYAGLIASKTGYTNLAGGNLAILFDVGVGHPVVAVILGSTYKGRFEDMRVLTQATLKTLE
jgi:D-alanyl-D-alanine carboxypeptidase